MRKTFIEALIKIARYDPLVYLIVGDAGFSVVEPFKEEFGHRFINAGVAEQNMIGLAAGLAMAGKHVYVYSFIPFLLMRPFEQIRLDIGYQNLPVRLIGFEGGYGYAGLGGSHYGLEDVSLMRGIPGMTVVAPGCKQELTALIPELHTAPGPVYIRLGKIGEIEQYPQDVPIKLGQMIEVTPVAENVLIVAGHLLNVGALVCKQLREAGIFVALVSAGTLKPLDTQFFIKYKSLIKSVFVLEEHFATGGFGEAVAHHLMEQGMSVKFKSFCVKDCFVDCIGSPAFLQQKMGLDFQSIAQGIKESLGL